MITQAFNDFFYQWTHKGKKKLREWGGGGETTIPPHLSS